MKNKKQNKLKKKIILLKKFPLETQKRLIFIIFQRMKTHHQNNRHRSLTKINLNYKIQMKNSNLFQEIKGKNHNKIIILIKSKKILERIKIRKITH